MKIVVYTDLDATLLDADTYSWEPARPALEALRKRDSAIVLVSSKTVAEMLPLHRELGLQDPFVVENGGGVVMERTSPFSSYVQRQGLPIEDLGADDLVLIPLGTRYEMLLRELAEIKAEAGCEVRGFSSMSDAEIAQLTGLSLTDAGNARTRDFDEPFMIVEGAGDREASLRRAARHRGLIVVSGGRFLHLIGHEGKGRAVSLLMGAYNEVHDEVRTIGLGDSPNDYPFLELVDIPVLVGVPAESASLRQRPANVRLYRLPGPHGWNAAVLEALAEVDHG